MECRQHSPPGPATGSHRGETAGFAELSRGRRKPGTGPADILTPMPKAKPSPLTSLLAAPAVRDAARALIAAAAEGRELSLTPKAYARALRELERRRGRPLIFPALMGGHGRGARVRLADGTWKLDFVGGIGVYGFGHSDPDLLETAVVAAAADT